MRALIVNNCQISDKSNIWNMNLVKMYIFALGIFVLIIAVYGFITPRGGYHTYYNDVFYDTFTIQNYGEKAFNVPLENQTDYEFRLSSFDATDLNVKIAISYNGGKISIYHTNDLGSTLFRSHKSITQGNYSFIIMEENGDSYSAGFWARERIRDYYPEGGRYGSINNFIKNIKASILAIFGIVLLIAAFWIGKKREKSRQKLISKKTPTSDVNLKPKTRYL